MADFLLELLSEEIPARMQEKARADLARLFVDEIGRAGLAAEAIETFVTPRRLALIARGLPDATAVLSEEVKGPRAGAPPQALEGFLRKTGLSADQLVDRGGVLFALIEKPGRATPEVLAEAVAAVVRGFPWPKSMRWGEASLSTASLRWVRPLKNIVALFGDAVVPIEIAGVESGAETVGHRFHHPGIITIGSAADYEAKLRMAHVILRSEERQAIIRDGAAAAAAAEGLKIAPDEGLVAENAGLTEWPVPLLGRFDPAFLTVPREVIQLTMRTNQKYFACLDEGGALAPAFVCTANIAAADGGAAIVAGNRKVLAARLSDARFFWEQDLKVPLAEPARKLDRIVFHEKLGTVADKVDRVAKLARWLVEQGIVTEKPLPFRGGVGVGPVADSKPLEEDRPHPPTPSPEGAGEPSLADLAEQAARLCKADLVTGMVGEFPELQGIMGGHYARAEGLPDAVADAIRDHYKPVGQGDDVPTAPVTVAVSLADKLDTLLAFWIIGEKPTGSRDPFALRRAALGTLSIVIRNNLRFNVGHVPIFGLNAYSARQVVEDYYEYVAKAVENGRLNPAAVKSIDLSDTDENVIEVVRSLWAMGSGPADPVREFLADRLKVQQREAGVRHDLIDAVFALGGEDDLVRLLARVHALQAFVGTADGANLLAGYKRAANILRIEEKKDGAAFAATEALGYDPLPEEAALLAALDAAEPAAEAAVAAEDFEGAMRALAALRAPVDAFFEGVTVNDADPARRAARLGLLARIRRAVHRVADFSRIEG
ncbi:MAG: glycine--tRNA ligase subunit beta [Sphingomonas fennica]